MSDHYQLLCRRGADNTGILDLAPNPDKRPSYEFSDTDTYSVSLGSQDLIGVCEKLRDKGWSLVVLGLAGPRGDLDTVRASAYQAILTNDFASGGAGLVLQTLFTELRSVLVVSATFRAPAAAENPGHIRSVRIARGGAIETNAAGDVRSILIQSLSGRFRFTALPARRWWQRRRP